MVVNINVLKENLQKLEELNTVMRHMTKLQRITVSEACRALADYTSSHEDPLLYVSHASHNPYIKKPARKGFIEKLREVFNDWVNKK